MIDTTSWLALGLALTLLGLVASLVLWRRRGAAAGLRGVAWSLLPLAAALTGVLRLLADLAGSISGWALGLVFNPVMWLGIALAGVSVVLFGVSAALRRRGRSGAPPPAVKGPPQPPPDDDLADIEAILRKHGIS